MVLTLVPYEPLVDEKFFDSRGHENEKRNLMNLPICAIDGEGNTIDSHHRYTLLQAKWPTGRLKIEGENVSSRECLAFLFRLPRRHVYVVYGASYDFNMWLRDLPTDKKIELLTTDATTWGPYHIKWIDRKFLTIRRGRYSITVYDVLAWWQTTFVKACKAWDVGTASNLELITYMKDQRGNFANVDPQQIETYCWKELDMLSDLVNKLRYAILQTPYRPKGLYGPGALASAVLEYQGVKDHFGEVPQELALLSYYGGRFDTALLGWYSNVFQHDIRSAYPDQIRNLPCLLHGNWEQTNNPTRSRYGIFHIRWNVGPDCPYPPFPWRDHKHCIYYPYKGEGWYHADEVRAAIEVFGTKIKVLEGQALIEGCNCDPFRFVENLYQWRLRLIAEGNAQQGIIVKLALNSLYGKLAQSVGAKNKLPPFQNFFLAGAITAGTRAKILRAIGPHLDIVVSIATDGIVALKRLDLREGKQLGEWEITELVKHVQISNGVYQSFDTEGKEIEKARGIGSKQLDYDEIEDIYREQGSLGVYRYSSKSRFISIREALHINRPDLACEWRTREEISGESSSLSFQPGRRLVLGENIYGKQEPYDPEDVLQFKALPVDSNGCSHPFRPKMSWGEVYEKRQEHNSVALAEPIC